MQAYLDILDNIMTNGKDLRMNRTGIPDIGLSAGAVFEHDMSTGFPLVTTKKMGLKNIATELEFFLNGITDKKWLQDRKCHIWDEWANPVKVEQKYSIATSKLPNLTDTEKTQILNSIMDSERDLGPIYGFQWRHFGGEYVWEENRINKNPTDNFNPNTPRHRPGQSCHRKIKKQSKRPQNFGQRLESSGDSTNGITTLSRYASIGCTRW